MTSRNATRLIGVLALLALLVIPAVRVMSDEGADATTKIERGKYLTLVCGCSDCHTPKKMTEEGPVPDMERELMGHPANTPTPKVPEGAFKMDGWVAACNGDFTCWVGPWGISYAANLTPDDKTGIGSWKEEAFVKAMRTGKHRGFGRPILPPMPWFNLAAATDEDLSAIFAYLKSIKPIENKVPDPVPPMGN